MLKRILLWVVPNVYTIFLIVYFFLFENRWMETFKNSSDSSPGQDIFWCIVFIFIIIAAAYIMRFVLHPLVVFGGVYLLVETDFAASSILLCIGCIFVEITLIYAWFLKIGKMEDESIYESGYHYEVTELDTKTAKVEKVTDYDSDDEAAYLNSLIYFGRVFLLLFGGTVMFILWLRNNKKQASKSL